MLRVVFFEPGLAMSVGKGLPGLAETRRGLQETGLYNFKITDAFEDHGLETWDDLIGCNARAQDDFDVVLLCVPEMASADRQKFFAKLSTYGAMQGKKPVVALFRPVVDDPKLAIRFDLNTNPAVFQAHNVDEDPRMLAQWLGGAVALSTQTRLEPYQFGPLRIDFRTKKVYVGNYQAHLTAKEYDVLEVLALNPGRPHSQETIIHKAYGLSDDVPAADAIDVLITKTRAKLTKTQQMTYPKDKNFGHRAILTKIGHGYSIAEISDQLSLLAAQKFGSSAQAGADSSANVITPAAFHRAAAQSDRDLTTNPFAKILNMRAQDQFIEIEIAGAPFLFNKTNNRLYTKGNRKGLTKSQTYLLIMAYNQPGEAVEIPMRYRANTGKYASNTLNDMFASMPAYAGVHLSYAQIDNVPYVWLGKEVPESIRTRYEERQNHMAGAWSAREQRFGRPGIRFNETGAADPKVHVLRPRAGGPAERTDSAARRIRAVP